LPASSLSYITVATTRPETMLGDAAVAINPKDPRAAALRGKHVRLPIVNRIVPIIEDDYVVLPDPKSDDPKAQFATGFLKVTPAHDPNDYDIGQRHSLPMINILAPDGSISDQHGWPKEDFEQGDAGFLLGLDRFEARKAVVALLKKNNLL
jgi:valyl-tRNA synthetase